MSSNRRFPFVAGLLLSLLLACGGRAEPAPAPALDTLMSQLGDASFTVRDRAVRGLRERAWEVREQLLAGLLVSDPEIRRQCRRLWSAVEERYLQEFVSAWDASRACSLAEWPRYRKLLGETKEARELFASMHRAEPELLVALSRQSGEGAKKDGDAGSNWLEVVIGKRSTRFEKGARAGEDPAVATGAAAALLYAGLNAGRTVSPEGNTALAIVIESTNLKSAMEKSEPLRRLVAAWVERNPLVNGLSPAIRFQSPKALENVSRILQDPAAPASGKQDALLFLAKGGRAGDRSLMLPLLDDRTVIDTYFFNGRDIELQVRDVALAAVIHLAGQDPQTFGFADRKLDPARLYAPLSLGFEDETKRTAALRQWNTFVAEKKPFPADKPVAGLGVAREEVRSKAPPANLSAGSLAPTPPAPDGTRDELLLRNGETVGGRFLAAPSNEAKLKWKTGDAAAAMDLPRVNVAGIKLTGTTPPKPGVAQAIVRLTNGDELHGRLVALTDDQVALDTAYAGPVNVKRPMVVSILPDSERSAGYTGPLRASEWKFSGREGWNYKDGAFVSSGSGSIQRDLAWSGMPMGIEFDLAWRDLPSLKMQLTCNSKSSLTLDINSGRVGIGGTPVASGGRAGWIEQPKGPPVRPMTGIGDPNARAHFNMIIDPGTKTIAFFMNRKKWGVWRVNGDFEPAKYTVAFDSRCPGMVLGKIRIAKYNMVSDAEDAPAADNPEEDVLRLANLDSTAGRIKKLEAGKVSVFAFGTDLELPIARVAQMDLAEGSRGRARRMAGDVFVTCHDGTQVTLDLEAIDEKNLIGSSENFGRMSIPRTALREFRFQVHEEIPGAVDDE